MKVLVIKLGALGDVLMATPLIERLSMDYVADELWLLTTPSFLDLFASRPGLSVHVVPRRGVRATVNTLRWLRRQRFDRLYDLQSNARTGYWCALSGAPVRVGNHPRFPYTIHPAERYIGQCHAFDRLDQVLQCAGHGGSIAEAVLPTSREIQVEVKRWLAEHCLIDKRYVLLHAGANARHPAKRWPFFAALAKGLSTHGLQIIWIGARDDAELNRQLAHQCGIDATSCFNVSALAELGRHARFAVTNDSAPMHILSCSNIPVFGIFGPTDWRRTHALGQRDRVITLDHARDRASCPKEALQIERIPVSMVMDKLRTEALI